MTDSPFHKATINHRSIYINMDQVCQVEPGKGYCDVSLSSGSHVRLVGEEAARFLRRLERPETASEK